MKNKILALGVALLSVAGFVGLMQLSAGQALAKGDCSANSVIKCGTYTLNELRSAYNGDKTPGTQNIFSWFGITSDTINHAAVKDGYVTKSGTITVDGQVVATDALTAGRQNIAGSTKRVHNGTTFYTRTPSVSFRSNSLSAFVFFDGEGRFIGAVIKDCGNPVKGTNKVVPPPVKPPAKLPYYKCDSLAKNQITRNKFEFTATARASNGAVIQDYVFNYGDGNSDTATTNKVTHEYAQPGTYTVTVTPRVKVNGQLVNATGDGCKLTVTVEKEKTPGVDIEKTVNGQKTYETKYDQEFTYELTVKNTGDINLTNVVVTDTAPAGVTLTGSEGDKGTITDGTKWTYTIPALAVGETVSFKLYAVVKQSSNTGPFVNKACVDAPEVPGNPDDCDTATVTVKVQVCDTKDNTIKYVTPEEAKDSRYTTDLTQCDEVEVCNPKTGDIITVPRSEKDKYAPVDSDKCKDTPPTPTTPTELPTTGAAEVLSGIFGIGSITAAGYYYLASRRSL